MKVECTPMVNYMYMYTCMCCLLLTEPVQSGRELELPNSEKKQKTKNKNNHKDYIQSRDSYYRTKCIALS